MSSNEYWIGEGVNYKQIWDDYLSVSDGYIRKFKTSEYHLLQITFDNPHASLPLFNAEVIYKTLKGCYHDIKAQCFPEEYNQLSPLYLYSIERGSGVFEFLGEFSQLITLSIWLVPGIRNEVIRILQAYREGKELENESKVIELIDKIHSSNLPEEAKENLINEKLKLIKIDPSPYKGNIEESRKNLLDLKESKKRINKS